MSDVVAEERAWQYFLTVYDKHDKEAKRRKRQYQGKHRLKKGENDDQRPATD